MRHLLLATAAVIVFAAAPACAADMSPPIKAPYMPPLPAFSWTGCYVGGHVGVAWSGLEVTDVGNAAGVAFAGLGVAGQQFPVAASGVFGGGQGGCNYQVGVAVFGIEGDFGAMDLHGSALDPGSLSNTMVGINSGLYGDITGRLGFAAGDWLFYGKGGWAFYDGQQSFSTLSPAFISNSNVSTFSGWAAGAGIEYHIFANWTAKLEYMHFAFGSQTFNVVATGGVFPFRENLNVDSVKLGANYKF